MTQLVTIQQAARNALATWLRTELAPTANGDGVQVEPRWFEPDVPLPVRAIAIIDAGPRRIEWTDPEILRTVDGDPGKVNVTWGLGYIEQRVQLDVFAQSDVELDDIMARLDIALNAGHRAYGSATANPVGVGVLLKLQDGWQPGSVDFTFDEPALFQTPEGSNTTEWRATYRGVAAMRLVVVATSAKIARIHLNQRLSEGAVDPAADPDMTLVVDEDTPP